MKEQFLFTRKNYILTLAGVLIIALGYLLMVGGGTEDPNAFSLDIFSFRRITLAPIVILAGFILLIYAIMYREKPASGDNISK